MRGEEKKVEAEDKERRREGEGESPKTVWGGGGKSGEREGG